MLLDFCLGKSSGTTCLTNKRVSSLPLSGGWYEAVASMEMLWALNSVNINRIKQELLWLETELP